MTVRVVERAHAPIDKVCGEGLMPDGAAALARLGIAIPITRAIQFRGIRFIDGDRAVEGSFPDGCGVGIRRTALHQILADHALQAGVAISWGTKVSGLTSGGVQLDGRTLSCQWIVGADGQNSMVRKWTGLNNVGCERIRFGHRRHYKAIPWTDFVEVYWGDNFQIVVTPVESRLVCAAMVSSNPRLRLEDALALLPVLSLRLAGAQVATSEQGAISVLRVVNTVFSGRVALVGDASGSVESLTGQGLSLGFKQASSLAWAIADGNLSRYAIEHRKIARLPNLMSHLLLAMDRHAALRKMVVRVLASRPRLFSHLLRVHVGTAVPAEWYPGRRLGLGWQAFTH
jgi:2-polyprenyl-6-methoxyphenol hydroxylase-like FAD-dependent oxidoreductase